VREMWPSHHLPREDTATGDEAPANPVQYSRTGPLAEADELRGSGRTGRARRRDGEAHRTLAGDERRNGRNWLIRRTSRR